MHGLTGPELERLSGLGRFMELSCPRRCRLWWLITDKGSTRAFVAAVQKRITKLQRQRRLLAYNATIFESGGGLHANILFVGNIDIAGRLKASATFGHRIEVKPVTDLHGLVREYLAKERTPQAGYGREHMLGRRRKGSHRLPGGGDRVRLSEDLKRDAIAAGFVEAWDRTYARRSEERKSYPPRRLTRRAPREAGQLVLLPEIERPVSRLRHFGGGKVPPAVALEIEHLRIRRGLSQRELAARIGVSQGQYANARRGHDPLSAFAVNRVREALAANKPGPDDADR